MIQFLRKLLFHDLWLKLLSLGLAVLIWFMVSSVVRKDIAPATVLAPNSPEEQTQNYINIPVLVVSAASDVRSFKVHPSVVDVTVRGETNLLQNLQPKDIRALVDLTGIESAPHGLRKRIEVTTPAGITFVRVDPDQVEVIVPPKP